MFLERGIESRLEALRIEISQPPGHCRQARAEESADLAILLSSIATACKYLSNTVRKAGLANLSGSAGEVNVQGEEQQKLDVLAHEVFVNSLNASKRCTVLVSEEHPDPIVCTSEYRSLFPADLCILSFPSFVFGQL